METGNPFAEMPASPESIIAQVRKQLSTDYPEVLAAWPGAFDRNVETVVRDLWQGRVKAFVPVLALREARDLLRERESAVAAFQPDAAMRLPETPPGEPVRDVMRLDNDVMTLDVSDVLRL